MIEIEQLIKSPTAERLGIKNVPGIKELESLELLRQNVVRPIWENWSNVQINSGFRCPELNRAVKGSPTSQHVDGRAVDLEIPGVSNKLLFEWCKANVPFDQLLLEYHDETDPGSGWVHISYANRGQAKIVPPKG